MSEEIDIANIKKFYEFSKTPNTTMYDNISYKRDKEVCSTDYITLNTGNLIKYPYVNLKEEKYEIDNDG